MLHSLFNRLFYNFAKIYNADKIIHHTMKALLALSFALLPMMHTEAQNTWEEVERTQSAVNPDAKYLAGAVPVVDGKVVFSTVIAAPKHTASEIYDILHKEMLRMTKEKNQFDQSQMIRESKESGELGAYYQEWLVFKNKPLVLDRTRLMFNLMVKCADGKAEVTMTRIYYLYDEERHPMTYKAEEWITDEYGLKKSKEKLSRVSGKFRKKTIDRKDYIFSRFEKLLNS